MPSDTTNADHLPAVADDGSLDAARSPGTALDAAAPATVDPYLAMIERAARDPDVDIVKLERLIEIRDRREAQSARRAYFEAFSRLQSELPAAVRAGTGHNSRKYARYEDLIEALRPLLAKHGFSLSHRHDTADRITVTGILGHSAGHFEETTFTAAPDTSGGKVPIHAIASTISYGKRYTTLTLTGIATEDEDDDAKVSVRGPTISEAQAEEIKTELEATGGELPRFCAYWKLDKLTDLPLAKFPAAMKSIHDAHKRRQEQASG